MCWRRCYLIESWIGDYFLNAQKRKAQIFFRKIIPKNTQLHPMIFSFKISDSIKRPDLESSIDCVILF